MPRYFFKDKSGARISIGNATSMSSMDFDKKPLENLKELHDKKGWVYCNCTPQGAISYPCLQSESGTYYFREDSRQKHAPECPLVGFSTSDFQPPILGPRTPKIKPYKPGRIVADKRGKKVTVPEVVGIDIIGSTIFFAISSRVIQSL